MAITAFARVTKATAIKKAVKPPSRKASAAKKGRKGNRRRTVLTSRAKGFLRSSAHGVARFFEPKRVQTLHARRPVAELFALKRQFRTNNLADLMLAAVILPRKQTAFIFMDTMLEPTATMAPVSLTQEAVEQLKIIRSQENIPADYCLRVGVKGGGCSGFSYMLGFDKANESDDIFEVGGIRVAMNKAHAIYLLGMEVDFHNGLDNRGFTFDNPNAKSTCGCGTSFSA